MRRVLMCALISTTEISLQNALRCSGHIFTIQTINYIAIIFERDQSV